MVKRAPVSSRKLCTNFESISLSWLPKCIQINLSAARNWCSACAEKRRHVKASVPNWVTSANEIVNAILCVPIIFGAAYFAYCGKWLDAIALKAGCRNALINSKIHYGNNWVIIFCQSQGFAVHICDMQKCTWWCRPHTRCCCSESAQLIRINSITFGVSTFLLLSFIFCLVATFIMRAAVEILLSGFSLDDYRAKSSTPCIRMWIKARRNRRTTRRRRNYV